MGEIRFAFWPQQSGTLVLTKRGTMAFQIITEESQSCRVLGNYLNLYLITDSHLKTKYVMIMSPIKLVFKPIRELRTIYSYYVPS